MYNQLSAQTSLIPPNQYQAGRTHSHHNQSIIRSSSSLASSDGSNSIQLSDCVADNLAQPFSNYISGNSSNVCRKDTTPPSNATLSSSSPSSSSLVAIKREQAIMSPTDHLQEPYQDHPILTPQEQQQQQHHHHHHHQQQQQQHHSYHQVQQQGGQLMQVANNNNDNNNANYYQDTATTVVANQECHQDYYSMVHQHHHHHNPHHHHHHQQQHHQQQQQQQQQQQHQPHTRPLEPFTLPQQSHQHHQHHPQQASNAVVTPNAGTSQCWPPNLNQSTPPRVATSPAIINQFHSGNHPHQIAPQTGPVLPAPVSPYPNHSNHTSSFTNGYQTQHQHQHYVSNHHPHQHLHHHHQHIHQSNPQHSQHNHHAIAMQTHATIPEDIYSPHQHPHHQTYNQFPHRSPSSSSTTIMTPAHSNINSLGIQQASSVTMNQAPTIVHQAATIRHYSNTTSSHKIASTSSEPSSSLANRINSLANNSASPKSNLLSSTSLVNNSNQSIGRRQSSSVISTSSAGSNPSDLHHSPTNSPSGIPPSGQVSITPTGLDQIATRQVSLDERLSTNPADAEQDSKESQLSQLHQQCAVLLDEQQQQQQPHYVAINSPNLNNNNNNGTNASNSTDSNNNNSSGNTTTNGNNSGRSKRLRTSFKHNQLKEMKRSFSKNQNPDAKDLKTLAQITGLSKRVLQVWFQNARAKFRRNNAKAANQQLYEVSQHTSHMLQFQHQQQQNYHHHHHHTRPLPADQSTISQQVAGQPHQHLPSQGSPTLTHTYMPLSGGHQVAPTLAVQGANNLIDQTTTPQPTSQPPQSTIHCNPKHDTRD